MTRVFCNICKEEITDSNKLKEFVNSIKGNRNHRLKIGIMPVLFNYSEIVEDSHICKHCIIDAVNSQDFRTKKANADLDL